MLTWWTWWTCFHQLKNSCVNKLTPGLFFRRLYSYQSWIASKHGQNSREMAQFLWCDLPPMKSSGSDANHYSNREVTKVIRSFYIFLNSARNYPLNFFLSDVWYWQSLNYSINTQIQIRQLLARVFLSQLAYKLSVNQWLFGTLGHHVYPANTN